MAVEKRADDLNHIHFAREPDREPARRKRKFFPASPPRPQSRFSHGAAVSSETTEAVEIVHAGRASAGVDPSTLLVLEFESENVSIRDQLEERFGAWVVDEQREKLHAGERFKYVVQFPDQSQIQLFQAELSRYQAGDGESATLPPAMRRDFFDALQHIRALGREDREGRRLRQEGVPQTDGFYLDVDFWHPGEDEAARALLGQMRSFCNQHGGRLTDYTRTSSLLLAKIRANRSLLELLTTLDLVARVDLPPQISEAYTGIFREPNPPDPGRIPDDDDGLACVIDSGVVAGHPMLMNWVVEERDFDSGENTAVDQNGHGTAIGGLIVYGDIATCIAGNSWLPRVRLCSAKVLRNDPTSNRAVFPEENRVEEVVERAIRHFVSERGCRVFNFSFGDENEVYSDGRQFPLAEKLDELARELDIVIVVSAGNRSDLPIPDGHRTADQFRTGVRDQLLTDDQRVCNPATAALAVTVGSIARSDAPRNDRAMIAAAPAGGPSPFTRTGPGYRIDDSKAGVKPDLSAFGGNYGLQTLAGGDPRWVVNLVHLGEPTIRLERDGRFLGAEFGTSFAAPHVTNAAAIAERSLAQSLGRPASANLIRAMIGNAAKLPPCGADWLGDEPEQLRLVGNGMCEIDRVIWSHDADACLVAEDALEEDKLHFYRIRVPDGFISSRGNRGIVVSLAYDPPVRSSRKEYLARTMRFELLHGLTSEEIEQFRAAYNGDDAPSLPARNLLDLRPPRTWLDWSTLQVRAKSWSQRPQIKTPSNGNEPELFVVVTCQSRFPTGLDPKQRYGLVVRFWHAGENVQIYQSLRSRVRIVRRVRLDA